MCGICNEDVKGLSQEELRSTTVRIATELIEPIDNLLRNAKDEFGIPLFRSRCDLITKAVKEFLKKYVKEA